MYEKESNVLVDWFNLDDDAKKPLLMKIARKERELACRIYLENAYAEHVTEKRKIENINEGFKLADEIESGNHNRKVWMQQKIVYELTGSCIPILP